MEGELRALKAWLQNDDKNAEKWFIYAIDKEKGSSYNFGPPSIQKPTNELYAEWLMIKGRHQESVDQYKKTLVRAPKRMLALEGMAKAQAYL